MMSMENPKKVLKTSRYSEWTRVIWPRLHLGTWKESGLRYRWERLSAAFMHRDEIRKTCGAETERGEHERMKLKHLGWWGTSIQQKETDESKERTWSDAETAETERVKLPEWGKGWSAVSSDECRRSGKASEVRRKTLGTQQAVPRQSSGELWVWIGL